MTNKVQWTLSVPLLILPLLFAPAPAVAADPAFAPVDLPGSPDAWKVTDVDPKYWSISEGAAKMGMRLTLKQDYRAEFDRDKHGYGFKRRCTVMLNKPVPLVRSARRVGMWVFTSTWMDMDRGWIRFLLRDAEGVLYNYVPQHNGGAHGVWNWVESRPFTGGELGRLDESMVFVEGGLQHRKPAEPLSLVGFELQIQTVHWHKGDAVIELGPVFSDGVAREDSKLYWHTKGRYLFGDMPFAQKPFVTAGDLLQGAKGDIEIAWTLRDKAFGRPVAQGMWTVEGYDDSPLARFQPLYFPVTAQGQYWASFHVRSKEGGNWRSSSDKLYIIRGTEESLPPVRGDERPVADKLLDLNPDRAESIYGPDEKVRCVMRVWRPEGEAGQKELTLQATWTDYPDKAADHSHVKIEPAAVHDLPVAFRGDKPYADIEIPLELTREMPLRRLDATLLDGKKKLESLSGWVGKQTPPETDKWTRRDEVATFEEVFENGNHLLSCAEWGGEWGTRLESERFEAWVVDVKKQNCNAIELFPDWAPLEPMPGVFVWDELDRRIAIIAKHGLKAMINLNPTAHPHWLLAESQANEEGMVSGIWHGGNNAFKSPSSKVLWDRFGQFAQRVALHCRNKPEVLGYSCLSLFFDHFWADHPWRGQHVDYSLAARDGFRRYLKDELGLTPAKLSNRWNQKIDRWDDVELPRTRMFEGMRIDQPDPRPQWADFIAYRQWVQEAFFTRMIIGSIREVDDVRPVGTHGLQTNAKWYRENDCFVCSGSSEGSLAKYRTEHTAFPPGVPVRVESIGMHYTTALYTNMSMSNILAKGNIHVQNFWKLGAKLHTGWAGEGPVGEGTRALAGWQAMFQQELGRAKAIHRTAVTAPPVLGLLFSRDAILFGASTFHFHRLDDYKWVLERAVDVPHESLYEDVTAEQLASLPAVVVDPTAWILPKETIERLAQYVRDGGKLILSPTGGKYTPNVTRDGAYVLHKALGIPAPSGEWTTAPEPRQPGKEYRPDQGWPFGITGRGTPGEQSLSEPGQTAVVTTVAEEGFGKDSKLVFRLGAYSMYNRDTWSDWAHMIPQFLYGRTRGDAGEGKTLAEWSDGGAAITLHPVGKGQVLALWGTPDWYNWKPAIQQLAVWAGPSKAASGDPGAQPFEIPTEHFDGYLAKQGETRWVVLRNEQPGWTRYYGNWDKQKSAERTAGTIRILQHLPADRYRVRDITPEVGTDLDKVMTREQLATEGITAELIPSETRLFRLDPMK